MARGSYSGRSRESGEAVKGTAGSRRINYVEWHCSSDGCILVEKPELTWGLQVVRVILSGKYFRIVTKTLN